MNATDHETISKVGIEFLSGESRIFWETQKELIKIASNFCDIFWPCEASNSAMLEKYPDWALYCKIEQPDGKIVPIHSFFDPMSNEQFWKTYPWCLKKLADGIFSSLRNNDIELAAKFVGSFSHIVGDTGQLAHIFDPQQMAPFFLKRSEIEHIHSKMEALDGIPCLLDHHEPICLGRNQTEFVWGTVHALAIMRRENQTQVFPMWDAISKNNLKQAREIAGNVVGRCSALFSDILFTIWCITADRIPVLPDKVCVCDLEYMNSECDGMYNGLPQIDGHPNPRIRVPLDVGEGEGRGIALLPHMYPNCQILRQAWVEYLLPPGGFKTISFVCGLNKGTLNQTAGIFEVLLDGENVWTSPVVDEKSVPVHAEINLGNATIVRLMVRDVRDISQAADTKFFHPVFHSVCLNR